VRAWLKRHQGRLHLRLLFVNLFVVLIPIAGLEFARVFERELLSSLERDMRNQAVTIRYLLGGSDPFDAAHEQALMAAAKQTRTRVRVLDRAGQVRLDSHRFGPPEGQELPRASEFESPWDNSGGPAWKPVPERSEVKAALGGERSSFTRVRQREPSVFLFLAEPIYRDHKVLGAVYVTRSTRPVMLELYRIRSGLGQVLLFALLLTTGTTLWLAYTITRPLERLSDVATRIARGEHKLEIPVSGSGEIRDLGLAFKAMTERLEQRMQDTATFAADVAHGFKSPLTSIRGAAELLEQGAADDLTQRQRFLKNIELDSDRLDRLVSRLLALSRIEASTETKQDLDLVALLTQTAERSQTPDVAIAVSPSGPVRIVGRKADLGTAFANLMDNAVKFSAAGSTVRVDVAESDHRIRVSTLDNGPGVPEASESRLFQRFFTTDTDQGTGLGLAIVKSVVEAHQGRVWLERRPVAPGACFVVEFERAGGR